MQFLKTLFWVVLAVAAVIFAMRNWTPATVNLWGGLLVDAKLPVLIYGAFLLGLVPMFLYHRAARWQFRRRLAGQERALADIQAANAPAAPVVSPVVVPADPAIEPPAQS